MQQQLANIKQKLQLLIKQYLQLQKENKQFESVIHQQSLIIAQKDQMIIELKRKIDVLQLNQHSLSSQDKLALEKRIDSYLKEIDLCLSLINND